MLRRGTRTPSLFTYQEELVEQVLGVCRPGAKALLSLPTGSGKTRTAMTAVYRAMAAGLVRRVVWLAPTRELLQQAQRTAVAIWNDYDAAPDVQLGPWPVYATDVEHSVLFGTPQAVWRRVPDHVLASPPDLVVFDEAHQLGAPTFRAAVESLRVGNSPAAVLGLSATPGRTDEEETDRLVEQFERNLLRSASLGEHPVEALQRIGVLAKLQFKQLSKRHIAEYERGRRLAVLVRACQHLAGGSGRSLVFADSVAAAMVLAQALRECGVAAAAIHGELQEDERDRRLHDFSVGRLSVLTNHRLLATGYDCPAITDVLLGQRIGSQITFEQVVGRVARGPRTGGSRLGRIWQFENHLEMHGLPRSYYRYRDFDWKAGLRGSEHS